MRYESFYPFARQQSSPRPMGQSGFGLPPFSGQQQNFRPPTGPTNNPFSGLLSGQSNQPFSSPMSGQPNQPFPNPMSGQSNQPFPNSMPGSPAQGGSKMDAYMQTANRFLNTAQQFAPVVQQIAPMVQNLPAMWRMYKGFQSLPSTGGSATAGGTASDAVQSFARNMGSQPSVPRIFQPPDR